MLIIKTKDLKANLVSAGELFRSDFKFYIYPKGDEPMYSADYMIGYCVALRNRGILDVDTNNYFIKLLRDLEREPSLRIIVIRVLEGFDG